MFNQANLKRTPMASRYALRAIEAPVGVMNDAGALGQKRVRRQVALRKTGGVPLKGAAGTSGKCW